MLIVLSTYIGQSQNEVSIDEGLILDLNADVGVTLEDGNKVSKWLNQVEDFSAIEFVKRDSGRKIPGSGRPQLKLDNQKLNGHNSLIFKRQELVNHDEDAFDHLITGNGYTWLVVLAPFEQVPVLKNVNSFLGNLKNSGNYEGFWGNLTDDNRPWMGSRNGITFGRWDHNNPMIDSKTAIDTGRFYLLTGRMDSGTGLVNLELFVNNRNLIARGKYPVNPFSNSSKLAIGQERDAIQHPGSESFDGEIARILIFERPISNHELELITTELMNYYKIPE